MSTRKFYNNTHYFIDEKEQVVRLAPSFHEELLTFNKFKGFKKIGGSTVSDVLGTGSFKSEFAAFCHIARIKLPVLTKKYIHAGEVLEPRIFEVLRKFQPKLTIENYVAKDYNYNFFEGKDDILSGVPDGYIKDTNCIVEIKTAGEKKLSYWEANGVESSYRKQAQLYGYLMKATSYKIVALFLRDEEGDYEFPENIDLRKRHIKAYDFLVNYDEAEDDIQKVKAWYHHFTTIGVSPKYNRVSDADQIEYLKCQNEQEWAELLERWKREGKADLDSQV